MAIEDLGNIAQLFRGNLLVEPITLQEKLSKTKAYVFDWDGVFNNGNKNGDGSSPFSEVDSMGINMLRFNHYLRRDNNPVTAIITGEKNSTAFMLARREHFHAVYYNVKNKKEALAHLCETQNLQPHDVAYFFDDVLDLSIAEVCGLRIMIGNPSTPMLQQLAVQHKFVDYITFASGGESAIREAAELLIGVSTKFEETMLKRAHYTSEYDAYITGRNIPVPNFFTSINNKITEQTPQ